MPHSPHRADRQSSDGGHHPGRAMRSAAFPTRRLRPPPGCTGAPTTPCPGGRWLSQHRSVAMRLFAASPPRVHVPCATWRSGARVLPNGSAGVVPAAAPTGLTGSLEGRDRQGRGGGTLKWLRARLSRSPHTSGVPVVSLHWRILEPPFGLSCPLCQLWQQRDERSSSQQQSSPSQ